MQRWGLMGGTFDPIHLAHLRCAEEILENFGFDRIVFIPSATPPLKHGPGITPYEHRERMVRFAVEGNPAFAFSDVENRREGRSYTVDTIGYFSGTFGKELEIFFIMGQDDFDVTAAVTSDFGAESSLTQFRFEFPLASDFDDAYDYAMFAATNR